MSRTGRGRKKEAGAKTARERSPEAAWEGLTWEEGPSGSSGDSGPARDAGAPDPAPAGGVPEGGAPLPREEDRTAFPTEETFEQWGRAEPRDSAEDLDLLCFKLAGEEFAIDIEGVWEIIRMRPATEIPRVPGFIRGIISLRGAIVPVIDLRLRLGFEPPPSALPGAKIIVAAFDEKSVGMAVDGVTSKVRVPRSNIDLPPAVLGKAEAGFLLGVCRHQGRLISVLNTAAVLGLEEEDHARGEAGLPAEGGAS